MRGSHYFAAMELNYIPLDVLGAGTFGVVRKVQHKKNRQIYAIKEFRKHEGVSGIPATVLRETTLLNMLRHKNICSLHEVLYNRQIGSIMLVLEYYPHTLESFIRKGSIGYAAIYLILKQLVVGMDFAHSMFIVHRDLKPSNILLTQDLQLKIADFGIARQLHYPHGEYTTCIMTLWYRAPEIMFGNEQYDMSIDIWSIGAILGELLTGRAIFQGNDTIEVLHKVIDLLGHPEETWPECRQLQKYNQYNIKGYKPKDCQDVVRTFGPFREILRALLRWSPSDRPSATDILEELTRLGPQFGV